jgi:hypothetical protein
MRLMRALVSITVLAAGAATAAAAPYEAFIDIESQEDLDDLLAAEDISAETHAALTELLARGVDLDTATREDLYSLPNLTYDEVDAILAYRGTQRFIAQPIDLVAAGALTEQKLLAISAFLVVSDRRKGEFAPRGWVRAQTRFTQDDHDVFPVGVRARLTLGRHVTVGAVATDTRLRLGDTAWDNNRDGLIVDGTGSQIHVPKIFARYKTDSFDVIAGSYRVGFGERLTFDNSSDYTPNGIYYDDLLHYDPTLAHECKQSTGELAGSPCSGSYNYVSSDYKWSEGLFGIAAGSDHIALGHGYVQAFAWGSFTPRSIYQYELLDRGACADPYDRSDPACGAPAVFVRPDGDLLTPAAAAAYQTLPDLYAEALVGGHLAVHAARRDYVGLTAYGATTRWLVDVPDGVRLDTQDWSRVPIGGRYGAVGLGAGIGRGIYDGFAEVTRSFDRSPNGPGAIDGGGGFGAVARFTRSLRKRELELSARYYDPNYDNPYAGSIAASDEVDGERVRGEHGVRARYSGKHGVATIRVALDLWRGYVKQSDSYLPRIDSYLHVDLQASDQLAYGVWVDFADKDLGTSGSGQCYEVTFVDDERGEPIPCKGMRLKTTGRARLKVNRDLFVTGQVTHALLDDGRYPSRRRNDLAAILAATWRRSKDLRIRGRMRWLSQDISDNAYLEQSVWTYGEVVARVRAKDTLTARADLFVWLDDRVSTGLRTPAELRLLLGYQAKF